MSPEWSLDQEAVQVIWIPNTIVWYSDDILNPNRSSTGLDNLNNTLVQYLDAHSIEMSLCNEVSAGTSNFFVYVYPYICRNMLYQSLFLFHRRKFCSFLILLIISYFLWHNVSKSWWNVQLVIWDRILIGLEGCEYLKNLFRFPQNILRTLKKSCTRILRWPYTYWTDLSS